MKKYRGFFFLIALMMVLTVHAVVFAAEEPCPPKTPKISSGSESYVTIEVENGWEYMLVGTDGSSSNWLQPSYAELLSGYYTFRNLKVGVGYRIYARMKGTEERPAWNLPFSDSSWKPAYHMMSAPIPGIIKTPDYPNDINEYLPAFVDVYDMATGKQVASILTGLDGSFTLNPSELGNAASYRLKVYSSKHSIYSTEGVVATGTQKVELVLAGQPVTEKPTEKATEKATEKPTEKATEKATEKPTQKPTEKATEKPTQKPTEKATEKPTQKVTEPVTEPATEPTTEPTTEPSTEAPTEATMEPSTEILTEAPTEVPTLLAPAQPTEAPMSETKVPVPGGGAGKGVWLILGVILAVAAVAGIVYAVRKYGQN